MKKILAILLAAMMVFTLGLTAFAEGEDEGADTGILLPEFPAQTENEIYFVSENAYVEAGGTYEIPVYIVSNYTPSIEGYARIRVRSTCTSSHLLRLASWYRLPDHPAAD